MSEELALYEELRRGRVAAFRRLVALHHETMHRVAGWYVPGVEDRQRLLRDTWGIALRGLNMFSWHTTFRAWLFGILVSGGRAARVPQPSTPVPLDAGAGCGGTRIAWDQLPWSPAWTAASWDVLEAAVAGLPLPQQETLRLRDEEGWPQREVYDVLGWTEAEGQRLLREARTEVLEVLRRHLGAPAWQPGDAEHQRALHGLLAALEMVHAAAPGVVRDAAHELAHGAPQERHEVRRPASAAPPDPQLVVIFRAWRARALPSAWHSLTAPRR